MPLYDFQCEDCGKISEILMTGSQDTVGCSHCGGNRLKKLLSAHSSLSGETRQGMPGPGDTACCGASPGAGNCAGPGSCCGRGPG